MLIVIQTPICLVMAVARYGCTRNTFVLLSDDLNPDRHRGRDISFRQKLVVQLLEASDLIFNETSVESISDLINGSNQDLAVDFQESRKLLKSGILPLRHDRVTNRRVELLSYGADNLLPFSPLTDYFRSSLAMRENLIWARFLRTLRADTLVVPSLSHQSKRRFLSTELETIDVAKIYSVNKVAISKVVSEYLPMLQSLARSSMIILAPDNLEIMPKHISAIADQTNRLIRSLGNDVNVLIKPHPATSNASELIDLISSRLLKQPINQTCGLDAGSLKSIPMEFLLLDNNDYYFVGVPSSSLAFINPNRAFLVKTYDQKLDALYRRNSRFFLKFHSYPNY